MGTSLRFPAIADGARPGGVQYFFVDDPEYFDREQLYGVGGRDYPDNAERFAEFARAAIELAKQLWMPDVIHCHDWQSALVPVLLRTLYAARSAAFAPCPSFSPSTTWAITACSRTRRPGAYRPARFAVSHGGLGVFWPGELSEGRPGVQRLSDHGKSQICARRFRPANTGTAWMAWCARAPTAWWAS